MVDFSNIIERVTNAEDQVNVTKQEITDLLDYATKWAAFYEGTKRFKMIGSANIDHGERPYHDPKIRDHESGVHFGLEVWDEHEIGDDDQGIHGRKVLDAYVEHNRNKLFPKILGKTVDLSA